MKITRRELNELFNSILREAELTQGEVEKGIAPLAKMMGALSSEADEADLDEDDDHTVETMDTAVMGKGMLYKGKRMKTPSQLSYGLDYTGSGMGESKMKITRKQLRRIIKESIDVINASTGEVMVFDDDLYDGEGAYTPDAPELAARDIIKRLKLTPLEGYSDGPSVKDADEEIYLSAEDYAKMDDEVAGKRHARKAKKERARLNVDNLMTRLEDWALNAREEYAADNPDVDLQGVAWDLAQGAEYSFEPDEWDALLYTGPFEGEDDLYTYIADLIA